MNKQKQKKHGKRYVVLILLIFLVPTLVTIAVLYSDNGYLLQHFRKGLSHAGNLTAFIMSCTGYLSTVTCIGNIILLCVKSQMLTATRKQMNPKKFLIFDNGVTLITYDDKNEELNIKTRKTTPFISISDLTRAVTHEAEHFVNLWEEEKKIHEVNQKITT